jgi:hypothetical protein
MRRETCQRLPWLGVLGSGPAGAASAGPCSSPQQGPHLWLLNSSAARLTLPSSPSSSPPPCPPPLLPVGVPGCGLPRSCPPCCCSESQQR